LAAAPTTAVAGDFEPCFSFYGCNMVIRMTTLVATGVRFDELLPLYAWQEDTDFSRQMAPFGKIVRSASLTGIHLGTKQGRVSGVRFGYSQIANPVYLMRKGTMSVSFGSHIMARNLAGNFLRLLPPEPHIDRIGRLKGNFIAILDFMRGRLSPGRILDF
jgi:hypothetical protein